VTESERRTDRASVVAVVPAYEPGANLLELVDTLVAQVSEVIVVDDGSPNGTQIVDAVAERGARLLRHDTNRGIAAALNTGVQAALDAEGALAVLTVDQDSTIPAGFVTALVDGWERAEQDGVRVGVVAPEHVSGLPDQRAGRPPVQSGMLLPVATLRRVGDFDERLFIDGVDDDYALRCLDAGLAVVVLDGLTLGHRLGATHEIRLAGHTPTLTISASFRYYYLTRNRLWLIRRHGRRHPRWAAGQAIGLIRHLAIVQTLSPRRTERAAAMGRGFRDGIRGPSSVR
jgi:rhamnosyltransferase